MIYRGRSIYANSNTASRLARYLLHNPKNERVTFLGAHGTAFPDDLEKSIDQMIWRAEKTKSKKPLYFTAISPDLDVDKTLDEQEWEQIRSIQAKALGLDDQPFAWVEHQKIGKNGELRVHRHVVYQRFDADTETMVSDVYDRRKNAQARAEVEEAMGHNRTFQRWTLEEMQTRELEAEQAEIKRQQDEAERQRLAEIEKQRQREKMTQFLVNSEEVKNKEISDAIADRFLRAREQMKNRSDQDLGYKH